MESEPEPDIAVVPEGRYADQHPSIALLTVEVAESSLEYDRETKAPVYAASSVDEYWIVDIVGRAVELYASPVAGRYTHTRRAVEGESLNPAAFPDLSIDVTGLLPLRVAGR
jgi:Uma2 family endonuclease